MSKITRNTGMVSGSKRISKLGISILRFLVQPRKTKDVESKFKISNKIACNMVYSYYLTGLLERKGKGIYVNSEKGKNYLSIYKQEKEIDRLIITSVTNNLSTNNIQRKIKKKFDIDLSEHAINIRVSRLKKKSKIISTDRNTLRKKERGKNYGLIKIPKNFSEDLADIVALLLSDGEVRDNGVISFTNTDDVLIRHFKGQMKKVFGIVHFYEHKQEFNGRKWTNISFCSIDIRDYLKSLTPSYSSISDETKIPDFILKSSNRIIKTFLESFVSCDGGITVSVFYDKNKKKYIINKSIFFAIANKTLKNQMAFLLRKLGFRPKEYKEDEIVLDTKDDLIKFSKEIGFISMCRVSHSNSYWHGYTKNSVLKMAIKSFDKDFLPQFINRFQPSQNNKNKIIKHLKNYLK